MLIIFGIIISNGPRNFIFCIVFFIFILYNRPKYALETGHRTMTYTELFIFILEIVGTIAFASSGAMTGIRKNMDIFGVNVLGITTAVGGGCVRDLLLGIHPPKMFQNFAYVGTAILTSCLLFLLFYLKKEWCVRGYLCRCDDFSKKKIGTHPRHYELAVAPDKPYAAFCSPSPSPKRIS